jgi:hypothetical protein
MKRYVRWFNRLFHRTKPVIQPIKKLREFVYLDEVSLRSLLSSQKDGVAEGTSDQTTTSWDMGGGTMTALGSDHLGKVELTSRFQTTNSSTLQTSRKATVQSWFREFHDLKGLRLLSVADVPPKVSAIADLKNGAGHPEARLVRGELMELRVRLAADPVFRLGTLLTEFLGMAEDFPAAFLAVETQDQMRDVGPVNKILHKLLAGLIPIRAEAVHYVIVEHEAERFMVHREIARNLQLEALPLYLVGVTEHQAYWRDIRRVLFSEAEFTVLCRISRDGLHTSWTPVKLADLFGNMVPGLVDQMNAAGYLTSNPQPHPTSPASDERLVDALRLYKTRLLQLKKKTLTEGQDIELERQLMLIAGADRSPAGQRTAFNLTKRAIQRMAKVRINPEQDLALREAARNASKLQNFPSPTTSFSPQSLPSVPMDFEDVARLIDVEVVAIYW